MGSHAPPPFASSGKTPEQVLQSPFINGPVAALITLPRGQYHKNLIEVCGQGLKTRRLADIGEDKMQTNDRLGQGTALDCRHLVALGQQPAGQRQANITTSDNQHPRHIVPTGI